MIALPLLLSAAGGAAENRDVIIETSQAAIEARDGEWLRVAVANEGQPELLFRPALGTWDWSATGKLFVPVENLRDEPLTFLLRIASGAGRSLSGKITTEAVEACARWCDVVRFQPLPAVDCR